MDDRTLSARVVLFSLDQFSDEARLAHVMHAAGIFSSVSQARKNGWDEEIHAGRWVVGKSKLIVKVVP